MEYKILIVDDAAFMRMTLKNILSENGYLIIGEAANGREAVQMFKEKRPDLVTMDITMPEMNGIEALKQIRAIDPHAVVVMFTAMGQKAMVLESMKEGAKNFIVKPFKKEIVIETLEKVLLKK